MSTTGSKKKKVTINTLKDRKMAGERIAMLTAYDFPTASILDEAGIEVILVGDSVAMVALGYENTLPVTMEEMLHHCRAVSRGAEQALLVGDMPFMSYQVSATEAVPECRAISKGRRHGCDKTGRRQTAAGIN